MTDPSGKASPFSVDCPDRRRPSRAPIGESIYKAGDRVAYLDPKASVRTIDRVEWNRRGWWDLVFVADVPLTPGAKPTRFVTRVWEGLNHVPA